MRDPPADEYSIESAAKRLVGERGFVRAYRLARKLERNCGRHPDLEVQDMGRLWHEIGASIRRRFDARSKPHLQ